jgi:hypothetical protein
VPRDWAQLLARLSQVARVKTVRGLLHADSRTSSRHAPGKAVLTHKTMKPTMIVKESLLKKSVSLYIYRHFVNILFGN